jgi:hypothetical protein
VLSNERYAGCALKETSRALLPNRIMNIDRTLQEGCGASGSEELSLELLLDQYNGDSFSLVFFKHLVAVFKSACNPGFCWSILP